MAARGRRLSAETDAGEQGTDTEESHCKPVRSQWRVSNRVDLHRLSDSIMGAQYDDDGDRVWD